MKSEEVTHPHVHTHIAEKTSEQVTDGISDGISIITHKQWKKKQKI